MPFDLTPEQTAYRDMWLAELWPCVPELPREDRAAARALAAESYAPVVDRPGDGLPDHAAGRA